MSTEDATSTTGTTIADPSADVDGNETSASVATEPQDVVAEGRVRDAGAGDAAGTADAAGRDDSGDDSGDDSEDDPLVEEGDVAGDYLERLLDVLDFDGDIDLDVEGDRAMVSIEGGDDLQKLVGRKGEVLDALQELTRLAVQQSTGDRSRLMLDVAGWRAERREELTQLGTAAAQRVRDSGEREELTPMTPFERKIVHDAVASVDGVVSESEGAEPNRRVVVLASS